VIYAGTSEVHYWLQYGADVTGSAYEIPLFAAAALAFIACAMPFVALGQALARAMDQHERLVAYGWDIAGSLCGTLVFSMSQLLQLPPWLWPPLLMVLWSFLFVRSWPARSAYVAAGAVFLFFFNSPHEYRWSPYYFVQYRQEETGLRVWVNSSFHQLAIDFTADDAALRPMQAEMLAKFGVPYDLYRQHHGGRGPQRVAILGAGSGNDVYVALQQGVEEIVAVEIDPVILALGREANRARPYDAPRVRTVLDDARHFLRTTEERFDMVILGTLDSQTLLSGHANLRLDNYVYTRESFEDIKRVLHEDGMMAAYYSVFKPWLYGRIYSTVRAAFGDRSQMLPMRSTFLFNTVVVAGPGIEALADNAETVSRFGGAQPATDDWPYIYLERPTVAPVYLNLGAFVLALILAVYVALRRMHAPTGLHANFFLLGVGFTLMESAAIVRLALVFGSTWRVSAIVFAAVLLMIFVANWMVLRGMAPSLRSAWAGLFIAVAINAGLPVQALFGLPLVLRLLAAASLIGVPVYFAALCFSHLFRREPKTGYPLGINLIGAMAGGWFEYLSMLTGMRAIWIIVLLVYAGALMATQLSAARHRSAVAEG
jgi:hypothetical protein